MFQEAVPVQSVYRFVLTGGPCAGKSTAIQEVADRLRSLGYQVYTVPELATIFHYSGVNFPVNEEALQPVWEQSKIQAQIDMEAAYTKFAEAGSAISGKPSVILCDRGAMDTRAYMSATGWGNLLAMIGLSEVDIRDNRYDAVCHMVTAANGAVDFYTNSNNMARRETVDEAIALDKRTSSAWVGHPRFHIVDNENSADFRHKVVRVSSFFSGFLDAPIPHVSCRRYLVKITGELPDNAVECELKSTFLSEAESSVESNDIVLRARGQNGKFTYSLSLMRRNQDGREVITTAKSLSHSQYTVMESQQDHSLETILRTRRSFEWKDSYFELDTWTQPSSETTAFDAHDWRTVRINSKLGVLITDTDNEAIEFPTGIEPIREITTEYTLRQLATPID